MRAYATPITDLNRLERQQSFHIGEPSEVAAARRAGATIAQQLGFDDVRAGEVALVITEAATNIIKHATEGEILLRSVECGECVGIEIIALDRGPGISNLQLQMQDGHSTTGTYGVGLGTMGRMTDELDIYSHHTCGTAIYMMMWSTQKPPANPDWQIGAVCIPIAGEIVCGDDWSLQLNQNTLVLLVADGLGHGPDAAKASNAAVSAIDNHTDESPTRMMQRAHDASRGTRGTAAGIAKIEVDKQQLTYVGVGNIAMSIFSQGANQHLLSHNGIVGSNMRKMQEFTHSWEPGALLVAHSDGIGTRWDLGAYPGLIHSHPALIATILYRDFTRGRDDSTVVVLRSMVRD